MPLSHQLKYVFNLKKISFILLIFLLFGSVNISVAQDKTDSELEAEMKAQRKDYQIILKNLEAEEFSDNPIIKTLMKTGELDLGKIKSTIKKLKSDKAYGQIKNPTMISLLHGGAHEQIIMMLAPLKNIPEAQLKKNLTHNLADGSIKRFILGNENLQNFLVKVLKSSKALPQAALILDNKNKLYIFILINVVLFVLLKLRKIMSNRHAEKQKFYKRSFFESLFGWLLKTFGMFAVRIGIFVFFFHKEAGPLWSIFSDTMLA
jgi:hypothetical protein